MEGKMKGLRLLATGAVAMLGMLGSAQAADMPVKAMPPPPPPPFSWTGFYLGGNLGAGWARQRVNDTLIGQEFSRSSDAVFIGGGQIGYNWQINQNFVLGIEWDFDAAGSNDNNRVGNGIAIPPFVGTFAVRGGGGDRWMSTIAARLGFANDHWLFYAKLGGGEVGVSNFFITNTATGVSVGSNTSRTRTGGMFGLGIEYAFTNNWTAKLEYDWISVKSRSFVVPVGAPFLVGDVFSTRSNSVQAFKVGFNYLFNRGIGY
jgi:outer membrane immunogenic protein